MTATLLGLLAVACALALSLAMMLSWVAWSVMRNSGWIDTIWSASVGVVGVVGSIVVAHGSARSVVVALCAALWSARLGLHIALRTSKIKDDPRYAALIKSWGGKARIRMFWFLQAQALFGVQLVLSIYLAATNPVSLWRASDIAAVVIVLIAVPLEALADFELSNFRKRTGNRDKLCSTGLWRYSRHPNYFFDWLGWCAYPLFAIAPGHPWGFLSLLAPITMYWLLVHVSGIPPLEEHLAKTRGEAFRRYQAETSKFFPMPPSFSRLPS